MASRGYDEFMSGLTRIELLILLFIGGVLWAIAAPMLESAREAARQESCRNNLKQIGLGLANYHDGNKRFPPGCVGDVRFPPSRRWSWHLPMETYYEGGRMPGRVDLALPSDRIENLPKPFETTDKMGKPYTWRFGMPLVTCPNGEEQVDLADQPLAAYVGMSGIGQDSATFPLTNPRAGMWGYDRVTTRDDVKNPQAAVIHVIETAVDRGSWYRGGPATVRGFVPGDKPAIGKNGQFGGFHPGVAMTLFVDGHVEPLSERVDATVFSRMATIAGKK